MGAAIVASALGAAACEARSGPCAAALAHTEACTGADLGTGWDACRPQSARALLALDCNALRAQSSPKEVISQPANEADRPEEPPALRPLCQRQRFEAIAAKMNQWRAPGGEAPTFSDWRGLLAELDVLEDLSQQGFDPWLGIRFVDQGPDVVPTVRFAARLGFLTVEGRKPRYRAWYFLFDETSDGALRLSSVAYVSSRLTAPDVAAQCRLNHPGQPAFSDWDAPSWRR